jgi:hypothetical protein
MRLSPAAFDIAGYVADCQPTLNEMYSYVTKVVGTPQDEAQAYMEATLRELARYGLITWTFEPNYGDRRGERPHDFSEASFLRDWQRCVGTAALSSEIPDARHPTLDINRTDELLRELEDRPDPLWRVKAVEMFGYRPAHFLTVLDVTQTLYERLAESAGVGGDERLAGRVFEYALWADAQVGAEDLRSAIDIDFFIRLFRYPTLAKVAERHMPPDLLEEKRAMASGVID